MVSADSILKTGNKNYPMSDFKANDLESRNGGSYGGTNGE
jgi:hypothetical protein